MADSPIQADESRRILVEKSGPIGWLRIHNPARMNAMSLSMWQELKQCVEDLEKDPNTRVIVIAGSGDKAFCAGGDISEFGSVRTGADAIATYDAAGKVAMDMLRHTPKPTVAMIQGYCLGGGMGLALQCDLRMATDNARLGVPAAKRGIAYGFDGVRQLVELVGPSNTKNMLYTARQLGADEALAMGLINEVHPSAAIEQAVRDTAMTIAGNAPLSVAAAKTMVDMVLRDPEDREMALCRAAETACRESEDYREATRAFSEKRPPLFLGR